MACVSVRNNFAEYREKNEKNDLFNTAGDFFDILVCTAAKSQGNGAGDNGFAGPRRADGG